VIKCHRWRVTEISQIILVLLDSRCPILHYPPSLSSYLGERKVILVLTKVDISGPTRVEAWIEYIHQSHPHVRVVQVESYIEKEASIDHQGHKQYEPSIPDHFRAMLVQVIKEVHSEMLEPPEKVKSNPDRLNNWVPTVKKEINWEGVMQAKGSKVGLAVGGASVPRPLSPEESPEDGRRQEPEYLTIGLIGATLPPLLSLSYPLIRIRPTECRQIVLVKCFIWCSEGSGLQNSWKGQFRGIVGL